MSTKDISPYLLEHNLSDDLFRSVADACTELWPEAAKKSKRAVSDVVYRRHDNTVRYAVPWVGEIVPLSKTHIIDVGCGCGSSSMAFAHFTESVTGIEIDEGYSRAFDARMRLLRATRCQCVKTQPESLLDDVRRIMGSNSSIVMLAVVEHLTEREQFNYLAEFWRLLAPGQALVVMETPNKLSLFDDHTFEMSFSHLIPDELFIDWVRSKPASLRFRDALMNTLENDGLEAALTKRRRLGMGVTPHVFELAFELPLNEIIVADGFDEPMLEWFPAQATDYQLVDYWQRYSVDFPIGFARSVLSFVFRKPRSREEAVRTTKRNLQRQEHIQKTFRRRRGATGTNIGFANSIKSIIQNLKNGVFCTTS